MYTAITPQPSNAQAWLAAVGAVQDAGGEAYNVVIDIADPIAVAGPDEAILTEVDQFLRMHHANTLASVANTIFPQSLLDRHGPDGLYAAYNDKVLPRIKQMTQDWGRYFERMTAWKKVNGKDVIIINPLDNLIGFMRDQIESERTYRSVYEMTIYDPARDAGKVANRQCLSFLSFKVTRDKRLLLTVMYRNHYVARGLGNFLGLGRLQAFVAAQSGAKLGSLTCISTHAEIDAGKKTRNGVVQGWTAAEANELIRKCRELCQ